MSIIDEMEKMEEKMLLVGGDLPRQVRMLEVVWLELLADFPHPLQGAMAAGKYMDLNGRRLPVVLDLRIQELHSTESADGKFTSHIFIEEVSTR